MTTKTQIKKALFITVASSLNLCNITNKNQ